MLSTNIYNKKSIISILVILLLAIGAFVWYKIPKRHEVLAHMKAAAERQDYEKFAVNLKIAYDKNWIAEVTQTSEAGQKQNDFVIVERDLYVKETEAFHKGAVEHTLRVGTIIHKAVPQSWRFRYLRTRSLEKLGRDALNVNDLAKAEDYAKQILAIMYQAEGVNLLADVYIKKLEEDLAAKNLEQGMKDYNFIVGYQISEDKLARIEELRKKLERM